MTDALVGHPQKRFRRESGTIVLNRSDLPPNTEVGFHLGVRFNLKAIIP